jgi:5-methylcytosine-specific restriction endonuclease McrBC GTP-binding regulatory subunit McrB
MSDYGQETERKIAEVVDTCQRSGSHSIIALAGVPGTGKSFIASIAAQRFTGEPLLVREIQFHRSFSYEEFIEGMRIDNSGAVSVLPGIFLEWNAMALDDPERRYLLLIEELTRADLSAVLGELMTYIEHRERFFLTIYSRRPIQVASNLTILATFNPTDRSALDIDNAMLRRLRIVDFPPSTGQLEEMLKTKGFEPKVVDQLKSLFTTCQEKFESDYSYLMPFGHGIFADINAETPDLYRLWVERIRHLIRRPLVDPHPFADVIEQAYPWRADEKHKLG